MHDDRCLLYLQLYEPLLLLITVRCRSTYSENGQNNPDKVSLLSGSFTPISSVRPPRRVFLFICGNRRNNNNNNKACIYSSGSERERETERIWKWEVSRFALKAHFRIQPDSITIACQRMLKNDQTVCLFFHFILVELVFSFCLFPPFLFLLFYKKQNKKNEEEFLIGHTIENGLNKSTTSFFNTTPKLWLYSFLLLIKSTNKTHQPSCFFFSTVCWVLQRLRTSKQNRYSLTKRSPFLYFFCIFQPNLDGFVLCCVSSSCVSTSSRLTLK